MSAVSKALFEKVADTLAAERRVAFSESREGSLAVNSIDNLIMSIADIFAQSNEHFKREMFYRRANLLNGRYPHPDAK